MTRQTRYKLRPRNVQGLVSSGQKYTTIHFYLLSTEIRDMVFALSLHQNNGKTPALLLALRGDKELYLRALKMFYRVNEVELRWQEGLEWFEELRGEVKDMVKQVVVTVAQTFSQATSLHGPLITLKNLTSLKLRSPTTTHLSIFALPSLLSSNVSPKFHFQHLTTLTIETRLRTDKYPTGWGGVALAAQQWADEFEAKKEVRVLKGEIEKLLGVKWEERWVWKEDVVLCVVWKAGKGRILGGGM